MRKSMTESRMQGWRALAIANDGTEYLIFVGMSHEQVKRNYAEAYFAVLDEEEQAKIRVIQMQRWSGVPDSGKWISQDTVRLPVAKKVTPVEDEEVNTNIIEDDEDMEDEDATVETELQSV